LHIPSVEGNGTSWQSGLKKLLAGRVEAIASIGPSLDLYLAPHPELGVLRLDRPIIKISEILAFSPQYYRAHPELVEAMWAWIAKHGQKRLGEIGQICMIRQSDKTR